MQKDRLPDNSLDIVHKNFKELKLAKEKVSSNRTQLIDNTKIISNDIELPNQSNVLLSKESFDSYTIQKYAFKWQVQM